MQKDYRTLSFLDGKGTRVNRNTNSNIIKTILFCLTAALLFIAVILFHNKKTLHADGNPSSKEIIISISDRKTTFPIEWGTPEEIAKRQKLIDRANSVSYDITNINCF